METLKVARLIEALVLVGQVYRNKDGSQPAEAVKKVLAELGGAAEMTLAEWAEARRSAPKAAPKRQVRKKPEPANLDQALAQMQRAETQAALRDAVARLALGAAEWQALAKQLTGRSAKSGKAARETVETCLSDRLLLDERVESVNRQFNPATPPPAAS
ncbi:MAG TPA: hypothetical protein VH858_09640 [Hyphomicrobiales bacterium]|jgi:hypothetical protein